ncbi:MAG: hypothetical protein IKC22_03620 [Bacilli bacterium]|nr:hypothetical protein [Bacilli bacterium]
MDKKEALLIWEHEYGSLEYAYDIVGRKIKREDYMVENQVGWVVAYMRPLNAGGTTDDGNTIILHHHTASEKGDSYPEFFVDSKKYIVKHDEIEDFYYIESTDNRDDEL